jgi:hypothetical protein
MRIRRICTILLLSCLAVIVAGSIWKDAWIQQP